MLKTVCLFISLFFLNVYTTNAQKTEVEKRDVGSFDAISVSGGIDLYISQGNSQEVVVEAMSKDIDKVVTEVKGRTLEIKMKRNKSFNWGGWNSKPIKVTVTAEQIKKLNASGGSDVVGNTLITGEKLMINSSGGSDMELDIDVELLQCNTSGGADLELSGKAKKFVGETSGGSDIEAKKLYVQDAEISTSGGSDATLHVTGDLSVTASGSSDVTIYGNPNVVRQSESGSSDITIRQ